MTFQVEFENGEIALYHFVVSAGDVNGDGILTAVDARWALQAASGARELSSEQRKVADVNHDGRITAVDARWILQAASGVREL